MGSHLALLCMHSSLEPGELSQWLYHDDRTIKVVLCTVVIISIIIIIITSTRMQCDSSGLFCVGRLVGSFVRLFVNICWGQISRKRLEIEAPVQWTTNRKWHMSSEWSRD